MKEKQKWQVVGTVLIVLIGLLALHYTGLLTLPGALSGMTTISFKGDCVSYPVKVSACPSGGSTVIWQGQSSLRVTLYGNVYYPIVAKMGTNQAKVELYKDNGLIIGSTTVSAPNSPPGSDSYPGVLDTNDPLVKFAVLCYQDVYDSLFSGHLPSVTDGKVFCYINAYVAPQLPKSCVYNSVTYASGAKRTQDNANCYAPASPHALQCPQNYNIYTCQNGAWQTPECFAGPGCTGVTQCTTGQTQTCTTPSGCSGTKTCSNGAYGECVAKSADCCAAGTTKPCTTGTGTIKCPNGVWDTSGCVINPPDGDLSAPKEGDTKDCTTSLSCPGKQTYTNGIWTGCIPTNTECCQPGTTIACTTDASCAGTKTCSNARVWQPCVNTMLAISCGISEENITEEIIDEIVGTACEEGATKTCDLEVENDICPGERECLNEEWSSCSIIEDAVCTPKVQWWGWIFDNTIDNRDIALYLLIVGGMAVVVYLSVLPRKRRR